MNLEIPEFPESEDSENDGHSGGITKIVNTKGIVIEEWRISRIEGCTQFAPMEKTENPPKYDLEWLTLLDRKYKSWNEGNPPEIRFRKANFY